MRNVWDEATLKALANRYVTRLMRMRRPIGRRVALGGPTLRFPLLSNVEVARLPPGRRIFAVGDLHGRADLLALMLARIDEEDRARGPAESTELFIGDYVDRGPHSREVIEILSGPSVPTRNRVCLRGNHEDLLLGFVRNPETLAAWRTAGALATLVSYGVTVRQVRTPADAAALRDQLVANMPPHHLRFISDHLWLWYEEGDFLFAHAGIDPHVPLAEQSDNDLKTIRRPFLKHSGLYEKVIVHGHSARPAVEVRPNRVNLDSGAFATGVLSCLVIEGERADVIAVRAER